MSESTQVLQRSLPAAVALALLLALPVSVSRAASGAGKTSSETAPAVIEPRLARVTSLIESAFLRGEADLLVPALSQRVKLFLAAPSLGVPDGYYGADQVIVLLRRAFAGRATVRFVALPPAPHPRPDGQVLLAARWTARDAASVEAEHRLTFVLVPEDASLTVREIRELK